MGEPSEASDLPMVPSHQLVISEPGDSSPAKKPRVEEALVPMSDV